MSVVDRCGRRKYLTVNELLRFTNAALQEPPERRMFALMLVLTGCRISEALALTTDSFDLEAGFVIFRTLKQRRQNKANFAPTLLQTLGNWLSLTRPPPKVGKPVYRYRSVRLTDHFMESLHLYFNLLQSGASSAPPRRLWPINRKTAYRWIKEIMANAKIQGPHATPHGLRHTFGMNHADDHTPNPLVQRLMGHADSKTTEIYQQFYGEEELKYMETMWKKLKIDKQRNFHL
ncbi:tyrosine-type recombinase/integrase [Cerasicoccus arenae]|nr:tyrosine-type recombinase/integrase [Cerasicoccus arenae]